jgi:hypothetical protein
MEAPADTETLQLPAPSEKQHCLSRIVDTFPSPVSWTEPQTTTKKSHHFEDRSQTTGQLSPPPTTTVTEEKNGPNNVKSLWSRTRPKTLLYACDARRLKAACFQMASTAHNNPLMSRM